MADTAYSTPAPDVQAIPPLHEIDLSHLAGRHLVAVYDALCSVEDAAMGVVNQPRCRGADDYGPGGKVIEEIMEWAAAARSAVVQTATATTSGDRTDAEYCRWIVVKHHALMMGDLTEVAHEATVRVKVSK